MSKFIAIAVVVLALFIWWRWPSEKLPEDFGLNNPPVDICLDDDVVVPCPPDGK